MDSEDVVQTEKDEVSCDGGPLGHPKVYLNLGGADFVVCPYCGRRFAKANPS